MELMETKSIFPLKLKKNKFLLFIIVVAVAVIPLFTYQVATQVTKTRSRAFNFPTPFPLPTLPAVPTLPAFPTLPPFPTHPPALITLIPTLFPADIPTPAASAAAQFFSVNNLTVDGAPLPKPFDQNALNGTMNFAFAAVARQNNWHVEKAAVFVSRGIPEACYSDPYSQTCQQILQALYYACGISSLPICYQILSQYAVCALGATNPDTAQSSSKAVEITTHRAPTGQYNYCGPGAYGWIILSGCPNWAVDDLGGCVKDSTGKYKFNSYYWYDLFHNETFPTITPPFGGLPPTATPATPPPTAIPTAQPAATLTATPPPIATLPAEVTATPAPACSIDFNGNGYFDEADEVTIKAAANSPACSFGSEESNCIIDFNGNGYFDEADEVTIKAAANSPACSFGSI